MTGLLKQVMTIKKSGENKTMKYNFIFYSIGFLILIISNIYVNNDYQDSSYQDNLNKYYEEYQVKK